MLIGRKSEKNADCGGDPAGRTDGVAKQECMGGFTNRPLIRPTGENRDCDCLPSVKLLFD